MTRPALPPGVVLAALAAFLLAWLLPWLVVPAPPRGMVRGFRDAAAVPTVYLSLRTKWVFKKWVFKE